MREASASAPSIGLTCFTAITTKATHAITEDLGMASRPARPESATAPSASLGATVVADHPSKAAGTARADHSITGITSNGSAAVSLNARITT